MPIDNQIEIPQSFMVMYVKPSQDTASPTRRMKSYCADMNGART